MHEFVVQMRHAFSSTKTKCDRSRDAHIKEKKKKRKQILHSIISHYLALEIERFDFVSTRKEEEGKKKKDTQTIPESGGLCLEIGGWEVVRRR